MSVPKSEDLSHIQEYTFEEFQRRLRELREEAETILDKVQPTSLDTTKRENYEACVVNLTKRRDLLDNFDKELSQEKKKLELKVEEDNKNPAEDERRVEVMQARSKLKNIQTFVDTIEAERKREDFYRKKAVEKYMENCVEIKKP